MSILLILTKVRRLAVVEGHRRWSRHRGICLQSLYAASYIAPGTVTPHEMHLLQTAAFSGAWW